MNVYLKIDYATGSAYEYSKTPKEGFIEHTSTKGNVSYRKFYDKGVFGTLRGTTIREVEFDGKKTKEVSLALRDANEDNVYLNVPLLDAKKSITDFAESIIAHLPNLEKGKGYRIYPYNIKEEGKKYSNIGVSFKPADVATQDFNKDEKVERLTRTYISKDGVKTEGTIPAVIFEKDFDDSFTKNSKERDTFLYSLLLEHSGSAVEESPIAAAKPTPVVEKTETKKPAIQANTEFDDEPLPF